MFINNYEYIDEIPHEEMKKELKKWIFDIRRGRYNFLNVWNEDYKRILNNEFVKLFKDNKLTEKEVKNIVMSYVVYIERLNIDIELIPTEFRELVSNEINNRQGS